LTKIDEIDFKIHNIFAFENFIKSVKMRKKRNIIENMPDYSNNQLNAAIEAFKKGTNPSRASRELASQRFLVKIKKN